MNILCVAEKRNPDIYPYMIEAAQKMGSNCVVSGEFFDDPQYENITEYFMTVEKNGPEGQILPPYLKDHEDTEILITQFSPVHRGSMEQMKKLKIVGSIRGGWQHINVEEATERGILVLHVPGRNAQSVSDYAIAMLLAEARELYRNASVMMSGGWVEPTYKTHYQPDLYRKTAGIVGLGAIGKLTALKLKNGWGMKILAYDPYVPEEAAKEMGIEMTDLQTLFRESDFISLHAKAVKDNYHMIDMKLFSLMKPTAFFVNTARASLVDSQALYWVLENKKIAGAALDVMDQEPLEKDNPFLKLDNVTITGHLAGNSSDAVSGAPGLLTEEIKNVLEGNDTAGIVNPQVLEMESFQKWLLEKRCEIKNE